MDNDVTANYADARRRGQDELRGFLLDAAGRLLTDEGPAALTMRRVAAEVGCSTTVLYTLFGGKDGLAAGLYREGFVRLRRRLDALPPEPDPVRRLLVLGAAYRDSALTDPHLYRVMFLGAIPGFVPGADARAGADAAFAPLVDAARACIDAGLLRAGDPSAVAEVLWAAAHGVVSLELGGLLPASEERFTAATRAAVAWFVSPGGALIPPGGAAGPVDQHAEGSP